MDWDQQKYQVISVRKKNLQKLGFKDFQDWNKEPNNLYIGRGMEHYVPGTKKSKWHNPFPVKKHGLKKCLELFKNYILDNKDLYNQLNELEGKTLGCWCRDNLTYEGKPQCHGDILLDLLKQKKSKKKIQIQLKQKQRTQLSGSKLIIFYVRVRLK